MRRASSDPGVRLATAVVVLMRVVLGVAVIDIDRWWPPTHRDGAHLDLLTPRGDTTFPLVGPWERWDALWYLHIARDGYTPATGDAAFPPLYPWSVRALAPVVAGERTLAALVLGTLALIGGLTVVYHLVARDMGSAIARRTVLAMALFPGSIFLFAPYSEPLFLLLSAGSVLAARRGLLAPAGALAAVAVLCRIQGVTLVIPLAIEAYRAEHRARGEPRSVTVTRRLAVLTPVAALVTWAAYTRLALALPGGPLSAEDFWDRHFAWPWQSIGDSVRLVATWSNPVELCNLLAVMLTLALLPLMWRRLPAAYTGYAGAMAAVCVFAEVGQDPLQSAMRILGVVFPVFAAVATLRLPRAITAAAAVASLGLMSLLLWNYVEFHFVG